MINISTGFSAIDKEFGGLKTGECTIVGARPAMGKTAFLVSTTLNVAKAGTPVAYYSAEMSTKHLTERLLMSEACVPYEQIKKASSDDIVLKNIEPVVELINKLPLYIDDTPAPLLDEIRKRTEDWVNKTGVRLVLIDYLQLLGLEERAKFDRESEICEIVCGLKEMAVELDVHVIIASQIMRPPLNRKDKTPLKKDLYLFDELSNFVDNIIYLHRPEYYISTHSEENSISAIRNKCRVVVAKAETYTNNDIWLNFVANCFRFED